MCFQESKLPKRIEQIGKPSLRHLRAAIVVAPRAVVDSAQCAQATVRVLLPRVANALNDLLALGRVALSLTLLCSKDVIILSKIAC